MSMPPSISSHAPHASKRDGVPAVPEQEPLVQTLMLAFAPMHKRAFGVAVGSAAALLMILVTLAALTLPSAREFPLHLLDEYFAGYTVTPRGIFVGGMWGFLVGFVAGWFTAFSRNLVVAVSTFFITARAELAETRDFLDHI